MGWIKRNLIFVIGGVVAILLLGAGGFYIFQAWTSNSETTEKLNEVYNNLRDLAQKSPAPGNEKINNTETAKSQQRQVQSWVDSSGKYFEPVASIPPGTNVTSESFASALRRTIDLLQREADSFGVSLPPKYDFSFSAQRPLVKFAPGSLEPLAAQLGEVKALVEVIFSARINSLDGVQRVRVSDDDMAGPQSDYIDQHPTTNDLAIVTPYVVTFRTFTPELGRVLAAFVASSNTFIVKAINIQPAGMAGTTPDMTGGMPGMPMGGYGNPANRMVIPGEMIAPQPVQAPVQASTVGKGGLQTVFKEQLLRVTMQVDYLKLLPKS